MQKNNALAVDTRLEDYVIEAVLGAGGFGITYRVRDAHLETRLALKEYFPAGIARRDPDGVTVRADDAEYDWGLNRFLDEARILARIDHPHVVPLTRYFRANNTAYIVMKFEAGAPLSDRLVRQSLLAESEVLRLADDVLAALAVVHAQGYLHRDLKPANLYYRVRDARVMLIDFGAARMAFGRITHTLTSMVTQGYSPPEQYISANDNYGSSADLYALGAVLYRCLFGIAPPPASERLLEDRYQPASRLGKGRFQSPLLTAIDRALRLRPEERYQTVAEMRAELAPLLGETVTPVTAPRRRHLPGWLVFGSLAALALGAAGWGLWPLAVPAPPVATPAPSPVSSRDEMPVPESPPSPRAVSRTDIDRLLALGATSLKAQRLVQPADDSALYYYRQALALDPGNPLAQRGLDEVALIYATLAEEQLARRNYADAQHYLAQGLAVVPDHPRLLSLSERVARHTGQVPARTSTH